VPSSIRRSAATITKTGLTVQNEIDPNAYPKRRSVTDGKMAALNIHRDDFRSEWNYTIKSRSQK